MAARGMALEINPGFEECLPGTRLTRMARDFGVAYFCVGSDAHRLSDLASGLDRVQVQLDKLKLGVATFRRRHVVLLDKPRNPGIK